MTETASLVHSDAKTSGYAFGVRVESSFAIPELPSADGWNGLRPTRVGLEDARRLANDWRARQAQRLVERRYPDGRPMMVVERDDRGYHVWAPRFGRHVVDADGGRVRSALPRVSPWRWERLLFAQVLPLVAALRGRELLHASAVSLGGGAIAFVGLSGAGKSSVAAHLVARGASLVTDDVLAMSIESQTADVLAYPGTMLTGLDPRELARMTAAGRALLGERLGTSDKTYRAVPVVAAPLPFSALYFLDRHDGRSIAIGACEELGPRLLGSRFLSYLDSRAQLLRHLDVCAQIAEAVPSYTVMVSDGAGASDVAAAVESHALTEVRTAT